MIRRPPRSTLSSSSAASDVYKRQVSTQSTGNRITNMSDTKDNRTAELASQLAARRYAAPGLAHPGYGYGYGHAGHAYGALSPQRTAYYGMSEHLRAEERFLEQRRTLYSDLRSAESREVSAVEKRLVDEQTTATRLAEEHDAARRAAEADAIAARAAEEYRLRAAEAKACAERAAEAAAALKRAEAASERATQARDAEIKAANDKAAEARAAESELAAALQSEDAAIHDRAGVETSVHHLAAAAPVDPLPVYGGYYGAVGARAGLYGRGYGYGY
eukprot:TRINITY_DN6478_c0_g1_i1.p1 TRINITY_DN6478_c0_g1~~TRINITY_DN6478_c0_g1_i1.p1  ORF type:complete len:275 (-),score=75.96 TRINITY_DN6478_c0_g1_i1:177-1001(-)